MARKLLRIAFGLLGVAVGCALVMLVDELIAALGGVRLSIALYLWAQLVIYSVVGLFFGIITFFSYNKIADSVSSTVDAAENSLTKMPLIDILIAVVGLIIGLIVALLICTLVNSVFIEWVAAVLNVLIYSACGYFGVRIAVKRRSEISSSPHIGRKITKREPEGSRAKPKVLDTSVIIDGRIFDIAKTGVLEGEFIIPSFVLRELRHIADSSDAMKRSRGRRGLDILSAMQKELEQTVRVEEREYKDIAEVDLMLLQLGRDLNGVVVTTDYNLNKVAAVQNVPVFNINELANAIKPVVLPGEEMIVSIVKEGKEASQGVGYCDDGTMIVVDGARKHIGDDVRATVTSVLQTNAGRMIFAKI